MSGISRRIFDKGLARIYRIGSGSSMSRVQSYTGAGNGTAQTIFSGTSLDTTKFNAADTANNVTALTFFDNSALKLVIGTVSGGTYTWGTPATIASAAAGSYGAVAIKGDGSRCVVLYNASGGTQDYTAKSYSISGTTPTLDQTLAVATGVTGTCSHNIAFLTGTRYIAFYTADTTNYPTVVGINDSAGSLTKDGSATTVQTTAMLSGFSDLLYINAISSSKVLVGWNVSAAKPRYCPITDGGTSTSAGTVVQFGQSTGSGIRFSADANSYLGLTITNTWYNAGIISAGTVSSEYTSGVDIKTPTLASQNYLVPMGDLDGDNKYWYFCGVYTAGSTAYGTFTDNYLMFTGIPSADEKGPLFRIVKTGSSMGTVSASGLIFAHRIDSSRVLLTWASGGTEMKSLVVII